MDPIILTRDAAGQLCYHTPLLCITILGGIRLEGLDRLRLGLEVSVPPPYGGRPPVRDNVDLYSDRAVEKFARRVATKLEVGLSVVEAHLEAVTQGAQALRLEEIKKQGEAQVKEVPLTVEEDTQAREDLQRPQLMNWTGDSLGESGIVGEEKNRLILHMVMTSRWLGSPLSAVCMAKSGVGKSHLMERVAQCFPEPSKLECTTLTPEALYYMDRYELQHRILLIEDLEGAKAVMYQIRELQTKKRLYKRLTEKDENGRSHAIERIVEGPVSVVACTTQETIYEDNANRSLPLHLDESTEQDQRIMAHQRALVAGLIDAGEQQRIRQRLQNMQRLLRPIRVVNPYAPLIALPQEVFKPRRTLQLLLSFIEAITFYHQLQREQKTTDVHGEPVEPYIETSPEDIEAAFMLLSDTLFRKSDELSGACRGFFDWLHGWNAQRTTSVAADGGTPGLPAERHGFTNAEIRVDRKIVPQVLNGHLNELVSYGMVRITGGNKGRTGYSYEVIGELGEALRLRMEGHIAEVLKSVRAQAESRASSSAGEEQAVIAVNRTKARKPRKPLPTQGEGDEQNNGTGIEPRPTVLFTPNAGAGLGLIEPRS